MGLSKHPQKILLTTGDQDGIGPEVTWKALLKVPAFGYFVWCSPNLAKTFQKKLAKKYRVKVISGEDSASLKRQLTAAEVRRGEITLVESSLSPAHWVELSAQLCHEKVFAGLVTAPMSKTLIMSAGFKDLGHTDILARVTGRKPLYMFFLGKKFSVILTTAHVPLENVSASLTKERLRSAIEHALNIRPLLGKKAKQPVRVLGLNPHSGDSGLIGSEDQDLILPVIESFQSTHKKAVIGPVVPDAAFQDEKITSVFVAQYHDQGLIPFKYAHGRAGTHLTLGLPFPRTSVDHGTAKDIAGKNIADPSSMCESILQMNAILRMKGRSLWK